MATFYPNKKAAKMPIGTMFDQSISRTYLLQKLCCLPTIFLGHVVFIKALHSNK